MNAKSQLESMSDRAYRLLREDILCGKRPAGQRLSQHRIARELGMTVNPFREALTCLERDGLVEIQPQGGARVRVWNADEIIDQYHLRIALECEMARRFCLCKCEGEKLRALAELAWEIDLAFDHLPREYGPLGRLDYQLHENIARGSHSRILFDAWERQAVLAQMARAGIIMGSNFPMQKKMHCILVAKLASGDPLLASEGAREHLEYSRWGEIAALGLTEKYPQECAGNWYKDVDLDRIQNPSDILRLYIR
jgi:GntR family transcriptional regulator, rspAB operon transcriptional repressor